MTQFFILLCFCIAVDGFTYKEHAALCRSPASYTTREDVETARECMDICDKDHRCLMVKYSREKMKCWLCENKSLRPWTKSSVKYDFYIKVASIPSVLWLEKLRTCKQDKPYKIWFIETAQECKNTCAEEVKCKMVKYSTEERKCFFSSSTELRSSDKCMVEYDFYTKVSQHNVKWIEHVNLTCGTVDSYEVISAQTKEHCKHACAKDNKCLIVMYDPQKKNCWKSSSDMQHSRKCSSKYNFYQKDICATMKKECKEEELCINNGWNHTCLAECPEGFYEENQACKDVNECSDEPELCGKKAECFNTPGSYKCICGIGHEWNSEGCLDMNECVKVRDICGKHAVCENTIGSYSCTCLSGFTKVGKQCVDVDECGLGVSICSKSAKCINTVGGYICEESHLATDGPVEALKKEKPSGKMAERIKPGVEFQPASDGQPQALETERLLEGMSGKMTFRRTKVTNKKTSLKNAMEGIKPYVERVELVTEFPDVETRHPTKYPPTMYTEYPEAKPSRKLTKHSEHEESLTTTGASTSGKPRTLQTLAVQVTEKPEVVLKELWLSHPQLCLSVSHYEHISNVESEKQCQWKCEQQPKCVMVQHDSKSGKCWFSDDRKMSPKSDCNELFDYYIKGRNECKGKRGQCHRNAVCRAKKGHKVCQCVYGFEGDGWSCTDINECSFYQNLCGSNGECVNTIGSYSCKCKQGFELKDGGCAKAGSSAGDSSMKEWRREHGASASVKLTSTSVLVATFLFASAFSF